MEKNQLSQDEITIEKEPVITDNSISESDLKPQSEKEDKLRNPSELILGKFKSTEDLTEAYKQLEKLQGNQSSELGALREQVASMKADSDAINFLNNIFENKTQIQESVRKYPEYFSDPSFKQIYTEAYKAFGADLDVDKLVNLVESYASARIFAHEKSKFASAETQKTIDGMKFDKNDTITTTPVKKSIQQMTPKELDEMLERLI